MNSFFIIFDSPEILMTQALVTIEKGLIMAKILQTHIFFRRETVGMFESGKSQTETSRIVNVP